jgi:acyl carrier protein
MDPLYEKVKAVLVKAGVPENLITPGAHLQKDLGLDSLDLTEIVMYLEDDFAIEIPVEDMVQLGVVAQLTDYIRQQLNQRNSRSESVTGLASPPG